MPTVKTPEKPELILQAALPLLVEQGFHGTPTSQIAKAAGVSNGTLFHYYATKEDLVIALYNDIKDELQEHLRSQLLSVAPTRERFRTTFIQSIQWALDNPQKFYYIQQFHFSPHYAKVPGEVIEHQSRLHLDLIREAIDQQLIRPLPVRLLFTLISSQVFGLYQYLIQSPQPPEAQQAAVVEGFELLWQMLRS